jgi:nucleoside-diphosphate-sugar epimerase
LGRALVGRLAGSGRYSVLGLDRAEGDLAAPGIYEALLGDGSATTVVHLAASLDRSPGGEAGQWRDTFALGRNVVGGSVAMGVPHLVIAGSMDELGSASGSLGSDVPSRPGTVYGLCKALLREVAEFETRRHPVRVDWFRPTVVYGPGQLGSMLIPGSCEAAARGLALDVTDGRQMRDFLFVDDLVAWIELAIEQGCAENGAGHVQGFELHHVGTGRPTPVGAVLDRIEAAFPGARFNRGARARGAHEPEVQVVAADGTGIPGWRAMVPWEEGIVRTIDWWRDRIGRS